MSDHWQKEREYWTSKVAEYTDKLDHAKKKRDEAIAALAPYRVGQEVEYCKRGVWTPAIVRKVEPNTFGCYYQVAFRKKNGEWGDRLERCFSDHAIRAKSESVESGSDRDPEQRRLRPNADETETS